MERRIEALESELARLRKRAGDDEE
jgi:hypothetical protein